MSQIVESRALRERCLFEKRFVVAIEQDGLDWLPGRGREYQPRRILPFGAGREAFLSLACRSRATLTKPSVPISRARPAEGY